MANFKNDILKVADDQDIEAIVIGNMGWEYYGYEDKPTWIMDKLLSWKEAEPCLDYEYDDTYGAPDCQAITAWTKDYVLFVSQYDGSTRVERIPRNPIAYRPEMPGG